MFRRTDDGVHERSLRSPLAASGALPPAGGQELPAQPEMRPLQESRTGFCSQGPQTLLPLAGLRMCEVRVNRGASARHGGAGGAAEAAGAGGAARVFPRHFIHLQTRYVHSHSVFKTPSLM